MRYCGDKICPDEQTDKQMDKHGGWTAWKHNDVADSIEWWMGNTSWNRYILTEKLTTVFQTEKIDWLSLVSWEFKNRVEGGEVKR